jgi:hypothetical protein
MTAIINGINLEPAVYLKSIQTLMDNIYSKIRDIEENLQNLKLVENASFNDLTLAIFDVSMLQRLVDHSGPGLHSEC